MPKKTIKKILPPEALKTIIESALLKENNKTAEGARNIEGVKASTFEMHKPISLYKKQDVLLVDILKRCNTIWIFEKGVIRHTQYRLENASKKILASGTEVYTVNIIDILRKKTMEIKISDIIRLAKVKDLRTDSIPFASLEWHTQSYVEDYLLYNIERTIELGKPPYKNKSNPFGRNSLEMKLAIKVAKAKQEKINKIQETLPKMEIATIHDEEVLQAALHKGKKIEALLKKELSAKQKLDSGIETDILDLDSDRKSPAPTIVSFEDAKLILCEEPKLCDGMNEIEASFSPKTPKTVNRKWR